MIVPFAFLLYRLLKKYPFSIALVVMFYTCTVHHTKKEVEEETIEITINNQNDIEHGNLKNIIVSHNNIISLKPLSDIRTFSLDNPYILSAYYKLFKLYQNLKLNNNHL